MSLAPNHIHYGKEVSIGSYGGNALSPLGQSILAGMFASDIGSIQFAQAAGPEMQNVGISQGGIDGINR